MKSTVAIVIALSTVLSATCAANEWQNSALTQADEATLVAVLMDQLQRCWHPPVRPWNRNVIVTIEFKLNRNGSLASVPTVVNPATDPPSQATSESALRAVRECMPMKLPLDKYQYWKDVVASFDPRTLGR